MKWWSNSVSSKTSATWTKAESQNIYWSSLERWKYFDTKAITYQFHYLGLGKGLLWMKSSCVGIVFDKGLADKVERWAKQNQFCLAFFGVKNDIWVNIKWIAFKISAKTQQWLPKLWVVLRTATGVTPGPTPPGRFPQLWFFGQRGRNSKTSTSTWNTWRARGHRRPEFARYMSTLSTVQETTWNNGQAPEVR